MPNPYRKRPAGAGYDPGEYAADEAKRKAGWQKKRKKKKPSWAKGRDSINRPSERQLGKLERE